MDFKEWLEEEKGRYVLKLDVVSSKKGFKFGHQSKQAEIDELQKRIDTALRHLEDHEGYDDLTHVIKILKGE